ncbi:MAG: hypothetical protein SGARI_003419, partial [Bacillariaceae sp.]
ILEAEAPVSGDDPLAGSSAQAGAPKTLRRMADQRNCPCRIDYYLSTMESL